MNLVAFILRMTVALVLLEAGLAKLRNPRVFAEGVADYNLVPQRIVFPIAVLVMVSELAAGALLAGGVYVQMALVAASVLFAIFAGALTLNLVRNSGIACHCFSADGSERISIVTTTRTALLGLLAILAFWIDRGQDRHPGHDVLPALSISVGIVALLHLVPKLHGAWNVWTQHVQRGLSPAMRVTFRYESLEQRPFVARRGPSEVVPINAAAASRGEGE